MLAYNKKMRQQSRRIKNANPTVAKQVEGKVYMIRHPHGFAFFRFKNGRRKKGIISKTYPLPIFNLFGTIIISQSHAFVNNFFCKNTNNKKQDDRSVFLLLFLFP